jgi:hypothetical protein
MFSFGHTKDNRVQMVLFLFYNYFEQFRALFELRLDGEIFFFFEKQQNQKNV